MGRSGKTHLFARVLLILAGLVLIAWVVNRADIARIAGVLSSLSIGKILILLLVNVIVEMTLAGRWWIFLRHLGHRISYRMLTVYKIAAIAISYITPGPQFGGEPFQVFALNKRHGISAPAAVSSLLLDRLVEMLIHSAFLIVALFLFSSKTSGPKLFSIFFIGMMFLMPVVILLLYFKGVSVLAPLAAMLGRLSRSTRMIKLVEKIIKTDNLASETLTGANRLLLSSMAISLFNWIGLAAEFWLLYHFLGLTLGPFQLVLALGASRIAFLLPIPAGLGTLEASQVLALNILGLDYTVGISACLIIRARDLLVVVTGLIFAKIVLLSIKD